MKNGMTTRKITKEFASMNILETTVEHNGYHGGDAGHGGFVRITFKDVSSTSMEVNGVECEEFSITFKGSTERTTFVESLQFILDELKSDVDY
jgi:hypothetical protein